MKIQAEVRRRDSRIDLIPLLDCIFLLVVFFMYAMLSLVTQQGLSLNLPSAQTATAEQGERVTLSLSAEGEPYWNEIKMDWEELEISLREFAGHSKLLKEAHQVPWIYVRADKGAEYGQVVRALDLLRQAELRKVSLETHD